MYALIRSIFINIAYLKILGPKLTLNIFLIIILHFLEEGLFL